MIQSKLDYSRLNIEIEIIDNKIKTIIRIRDIQNIIKIGIKIDIKI